MLFQSNVQRITPRLCQARKSLFNEHPDSTHYNAQTLKQDLNLPDFQIYLNLSHLLRILIMLGRFFIILRRYYLGMVLCN